MIRTYGGRTYKRNGSAFQQGGIATGPGADNECICRSYGFLVNQMSLKSRQTGKPERNAFQKRDLVVCYNMWYAVHDQRMMSSLTTVFFRPAFSFPIRKVFCMSSWQRRTEDLILTV